MKQKTAPKHRAVAKARRDGLAPLIAEVRHLVQSARRGAASVVDTFQVLTNFEIGRRIVEHEQKGAARADYGTELLKALSARLTAELGRGFSRTNLQAMRGFFLAWQNRVPRICQRPSGKSFTVELGDSSAASAAICQKPSGQLEAAEIFQKPSEKLGAIPISAKPARQSPFTLSWSHYVELLSVKNPDERSFYEIEATNSGWSVPELRRQKASCLYERLALSRDKAGIKHLAREGQLITKPEDLFKEPLVLEFLGLDKLTHQDLGQMQMYVNHYDRNVKLPDENPTVGLLLCKEKKDAAVRLTLPQDANIHAKEYQLYLPSKQLLKTKLLEWSRSAQAAR